MGTCDEAAPVTFGGNLLLLVQRGLQSLRCQPRRHGPVVRRRARSTNAGLDSGLFSLVLPENRIYPGSALYICSVVVQFPGAALREVNAIGSMFFVECS